MFLQLWFTARTRRNRAPRDRHRRNWTQRPVLDWLDERCLLSAHVVTHLDQSVRPPALVTFTDEVPEPAPSGGLAKAATRALAHNPAASSSATNGGARSTSSLLASP